MNLLPYDKFCIVTPLSPAEVDKQLQAEISPRPTLFHDTGDAYFMGSVANGIFKFSRIIRNRNSFLPVVIVHTESWLNGSRVFVKIRLYLFMAVFMCFWLGGVAVAGISMLIN